MSCLQLYDVERENSGSMRLVVDRNHMWEVGQTLTVTFFHDPNIKDDEEVNAVTPKVRHLIEHYARIWERWANIKFKFVEDDDAVIRITSKKGVSNSAVGTDATGRQFNGRGTMNLDLSDRNPPEEFSRTTSHEFGHAIGCKHEQLNPNLKVHWIQNNIYSYFRRFHWSDRLIERAFNNFQPLSPRSGYESSAWDEKSIMHYHLDPSWTEERVVATRHRELSQRDKEWIGQKYPFNDTPVTGSGADKLLDRTSYAVTDSYQYRAARMYHTLFCQSESYSLYKLTYLYRCGNPKILDPDWESERINLPLHGADAPSPGTPLAAIRHSGEDFADVIHLYYLDREDYIRECVYVNDTLKCTNKLNVKAASFSRLGAAHWRGNDEHYVRLFYQSAEGDHHIQEYNGTIRWSGNTAVTSWCMGARLPDNPLPGSELSFVNLYIDKPCIRGYFQNTAGAIKEYRFNNGSWSVNQDWMIYDIHYATSFAAMVYDYLTENPKAMLYYKGRERNDIDQYLVMKTMPGIGQEDTVCQQDIDRDSRMGFTHSDAGFRVFSTTGGKLLQRVSPGKGMDYTQPKEVKLDWSSHLGYPGNDGW